MASLSRDMSMSCYWVAAKQCYSRFAFLERICRHPTLQMALKFYYDVFSQPCRAVMIFLKLNKIPFEPKEINLFAGEQYSEEFGKLNRFRKVPVITDGNFTLLESVAILRYLCREKDVADHWYPRDSQQQAVVDEYLEWQHLNTRLNISVYLLRKFMLPMVTGKAPQAEKLAEALKHMENTLDVVEKKWLGDGKPYLTGGHISIADLLGACEVEQSKMTGYEPAKGRPNIAAWLARVQLDTQPYYDEAHRKMWSVAKKHKGVPPSTPSNL